VPPFHGPAIGMTQPVDGKRADGRRNPEKLPLGPGGHGRVATPQASSARRSDPNWGAPVRCSTLLLYEASGPGLRNFESSLACGADPEIASAWQRSSRGEGREGQSAGARVTVNRVLRTGGCGRVEPVVPAETL